MCEERDVAADLAVRALEELLYPHQLSDYRSSSIHEFICGGHETLIQRELDSWLRRHLWSEKISAELKAITSGVEVCHPGPMKLRVELVHACCLAPRMPRKEFSIQVKGFYGYALLRRCPSIQDILTMVRLRLFEIGRIAGASLNGVNAKPLGHECGNMGKRAAPPTRIRPPQCVGDRDHR
jgi:hypothetical protein